MIEDLGRREDFYVFERMRNYLFSERLEREEPVFCADTLRRCEVVIF